MWILVLLLILLTFFQVTLAPFLAIDGVNLNLLLNFLVLAAFNFSLEQVLILALLGGLTFDFLMLRLLGPTSFFLMAAVVVVTVLRGVLLQNKFLSFLILWLLCFWAWNIFLSGRLVFPTLSGIALNLAGLWPLHLLQRFLCNENRLKLS